MPTRGVAGGSGGRVCDHFLRQIGSGLKPGPLVKMGQIQGDSNRIKPTFFTSDGENWDGALERERVRRPGTIRHRDGSGDIFPAHGERVRKSTPESGKIRPNQTKSDPPSLGASEGRPSYEVGLEEPTESLYSGPDSMDRQKRRNGRGYLNGRNLCWGILL
jgi:hypothetical protein